MKRWLALMLAMLMVLAACSGSGEKSNDKTESGKMEDVKIGFIFLGDENSTYDKNFINAAMAMKENLKLSDEQVIFKKNVPEGADAYEAAADLADRGCDIVFANSFGHEQYVIQAAQEFPEVEFAHATGTMAHTSGLDNFHNAFASIYEGRYLTGVAAGLKLNEMIEEGKIKENEAKLGYVGAYTYAEVISGYSAFYLGAKSICPSVTMDVQFTGTWYDETAEKEAANMLINNGAVLISQHADSMGAPTACEEAGVPNVSYNGSTIEAAPNTYLISSTIHWQPYFEYLVKQVSNGEKIASDWSFGISEGSVGVNEMNPAIAPKGGQEKLNEIKEKLLNKEIFVFDTKNFTVDGKTLESYMADVDTDPEYKPDTEVIKDGIFEESVFRAAPYFDLRIDGIHMINEKF